jgi:hypothetical protein
MTLLPGSKLDPLRNHLATGPRRLLEIASGDAGRSPLTGGENWTEEFEKK